MKGHIFRQEESSNEKAGDGEELEAASFCGAAYGIKIPNLSQYPVILNATGVSVPKLPSNTPISNVEFLTDMRVLFVANLTFKHILFKTNI